MKTNIFRALVVFSLMLIYAVPIRADMKWNKTSSDKEKIHGFN